MEKWFVANKKADFNAMAEKYQISPVMARILRNRDLIEDEDIERFLRGTIKDCHSPWLMKDMDKAVDTVIGAMEAGLKVRVIGDYDVDGICSSYILTKAFGAAGLTVDTAIPHRIHDGYGLSEHLVDLAHDDGVQLIVTCDNGIAAKDQIAHAYSYGMKVVVTDHHEVPFEMVGEERRELLPKAEAVVDPKRSECGYPFKGICGGVVAYKLVQALRDRLKEHPDVDIRRKSVNLGLLMNELLEFAAFSTVCDVMELKDENRVIVKEGLIQMKNSNNPGIRALIEAYQLDPGKLSAYHLGFILGPCLNATGRLDTALRALELLQSPTKEDAMPAAQNLKELNEQRKSMTMEGVEKAEEYLQNGGYGNDKVLVVYLPEVHESIAGIIAGRIRENHNRPVFVLTKGEEGVKGSGRSIDTYDMYTEMTKVKPLIEKFGGHKMAAGLSLKEENIEPFRKALNDNCQLTEKDFVAKVHIDVALPFEYASLALAEELELLEPFGVANPKPLFAQKDVVLLGGVKMGKNKNCARYKMKTPSGSCIQMVFFGDLEAFHQFLDDKYGAGSSEILYDREVAFRLSVTYQLGVNSYNGRTEAQYLMKNYC